MYEYIIATKTTFERTCLVQVAVYHLPYLCQIKPLIWTTGLFIPKKQSSKKNNNNTLFQASNRIFGTFFRAQNPVLTLRKQTVCPLKMVVGEAKKNPLGSGILFWGELFIKPNQWVVSRIHDPWAGACYLLTPAQNWNYPIVHVNKPALLNSWVYVRSLMIFHQPRCKPMIPRESLETWEWYGKLMGRGPSGGRWRNSNIYLRHNLEG